MRRQNQHTYQPRPNHWAVQALSLAVAARARIPAAETDADNFGCVRALATLDTLGVGSSQEIAARGLFALEIALRDERLSSAPLSHRKHDAHHRRPAPEAIRDTARRLLDAAGRRRNAVTPNPSPMGQPLVDEELAAAVAALSPASPPPLTPKHTPRHPVEKPEDFRVAVQLDADSFVQIHTTAIRRQVTMAQVLSEFLKKQLELYSLE